MYKELLIGCGRFTDKRLKDDAHPEWENLTTLDNNPDVNPDIVHDLKQFPLPFDDDTFDELHAYEVLEHLYPQGDYVSFFEEFTEYHRILKPGGRMFITVPAVNSVWAFGDPSHTRVMPFENFVFLHQKFYEDNIKDKTQVSDFRYIWKKDFVPVHVDQNETNLHLVLKALP